MGKTILLFAATVLAIGACAQPTMKSPEVDSAAARREAAKQRELALERRLEYLNRLAVVGYRIRAAATDICLGDQAREFGFLTWDTAMFESGFETTASALGAKRRPTIMRILPGSPAEAAGLAPGDELMALNRKSVKEDAKAINKRLQDEAKRASLIAVRYRRDGVAHETTMRSALVCDFAPQFEDTDVINAYADGSDIYITKGMLRFIESDDELALVIGHEIAHNVLDHGDAKRTNSIGGGAVALLADIGFAVLGVNTQGAFMKAGARAGAGAYSVDFEREADYVGVYMAARAGYDTAGAANLWRRMGAENPDRIKPDRIEIAQTHPTTPARFVALEAATAEISAKAANGEALIPDRK